MTWSSTEMIHGTSALTAPSSARIPRLSVRCCMTRARFNHMELTFERGTLDGALRADIDAFYGDVFGWQAKDIDLLDQKCHFLRIDEGQFILLAESKKPMLSPGYDHLGLLMDTREEVDEALDKAQRF